MQSFPFQGKLQVSEYVIALFLSGWQIFNLPPIFLLQAPGPLHQNPAFLPVRHHGHLESLGQPLVSNRLTVGAFHPVLITKFSKRLQMANFYKFQLRPSSLVFAFEDGMGGLLRARLNVPGLAS
ncbi:MAG: hypothetical protein ABIS50_21700 [Luteolibacter sp.]|uniref:hypothetical protein n=1 Tax=Luteolibacter sp. TaxID=1962973 RepID=UPI00326796BC